MEKKTKERKEVNNEEEKKGRNEQRVARGLGPDRTGRRNLNFATSRWNRALHYMSLLLVATPSAYLACASRSRQCTATSHSGLLITVAVAWPLTCNIGIAGFCRGPWKSHEKKIKLAVVVNRSPISAGHVHAPVTISRGQWSWTRRILLVKWSWTRRDLRAFRSPD